MVLTKPQPEQSNKMALPSFPCIKIDLLLLFFPHTSQQTAIAFVGLQLYCASSHSHTVEVKTGTGCALEEERL